MLNYLPNRLVKIFKKVNLNSLCEIRLRQNSKILLNVDGSCVFFNDIVTREEIEEIVYNACKKSIYSYEEQIKRGYITLQTGVRIGLCGEFVTKNGEVTAIKNFSSLCIRFPHEKCGFALNFVSNVYDGGSVLVISKSGVGKTTFIRDFSRCINKNNCVNTIIIDERNEIAPHFNGFSFDVGETVDVLTYSSKSYGFNQAIRTLNPSLIITDELMNESDIKGVKNAILSGVDVVATIHANSLNDVFNKDFMKDYKNIFSYYVLLEIVKNSRLITVFNNNGEKICQF
ncbi:MAG: hypothetical protein J6R29_06185 [Clostridia bacterium]|nr:hypothetical protein [Clostridia bacterium]